MRSEYTGWQAGRGGRDRGARSVQERARPQIGGTGHGKRTPSIQLISVTLEVLKLSDWLNAEAPCQGSKEVDAARRVAGREAAGDRGANAQRAEKGSTADWGQGSTGTAKWSSWL